MASQAKSSSPTFDSKIKEFVAVIEDMIGENPNSVEYIIQDFLNTRTVDQIVDEVASRFSEGAQKLLLTRDLNHLNNVNLVRRSGTPPPLLSGQPRNRGVYLCHVLTPKSGDYAYVGMNASADGLRVCVIAFRVKRRHY